jgi:hypothetical protein
MKNCPGGNSRSPLPLPTASRSGETDDQRGQRKPARCRASTAHRADEPPCSICSRWLAELSIGASRSARPAGDCGSSSPLFLPILTGEQQAGRPGSAAIAPAVRPPESPDPTKPVEPGIVPHPSFSTVSALDMPVSYAGPGRSPHATTPGCPARRLSAGRLPVLPALGGKGWIPCRSESPGRAPVASTTRRAAFARARLGRPSVFSWPASPFPRSLTARPSTSVCGTLCTPPLPTGACCDVAVGMPACQILTAVACEALGTAWVWRGVDVPCDLQSCPVPVPTEHKSWGQVKSLYR